MSALTGDVPVWVPATEDDDSRGFTLAEAYEFLGGTPGDILVAAANEGHTGAMIALVPSDADVARLAVEGGEDPEQLHLTLAFLGEAAAISDETRAQVADVARRAVKSSIEANAFSVNVFNPTGPEPCVVLGVGNAGPELSNLQGTIISALRGLAGLTLPEQHTPWVPHVTLAYTDDMTLAATLADRTGPITFDKIRVAFGDDVEDIPLSTQHSDSVDDVAVNGNDDKEYAAAMSALVDWLNAEFGGDDDALTTFLLEEFDVSKMPPQLQKYWLGPEGSARVGGWGNDGSFTKCTVEMRKEGVPGRMVKGVCGNLYKHATGHGPTAGKHKHGHKYLQGDVMNFADNPDEPYGDVKYADPGYQADGKKRYPINTPEHIRAAWSYINMPKNASKYSDEDLAKIRKRIQSAMSGAGIGQEAGLEFKFRKDQLRGPDGEWIDDHIPNLGDIAGDDGPSRGENSRRLRQLERQAEGDEGLNRSESDELNRLRRMKKSDARERRTGNEDQGGYGGRTDAPKPKTHAPSDDIDYEDESPETPNAKRLRELETLPRSMTTEEYTEVKALRKKVAREKREYEDMQREMHRGDDNDYALTAAAKSKVANPDVEERDAHPMTEGDEPWEGTLVVEGVESGDGRLFALGSLDWATLPLPLMYQPANSGGHTDSIHVGEITNAARRENQVYGWGHVFASALAGEHADGIRHMLGTPGKPSSGGVSVDVDKVKDADVEMVYAETDPDAGPGANAFAKPETTIFHRGRIRGATLVAFPAFVEAKLHLTGGTVTASAGCGCGEDQQVLVAAGHTITLPDVPPAEWFERPTDVKMYGALTITDEGRVFGRVAPSGVTHRGVKRQVPMKTVDYSRWMGGETIVAGGGRVVTGPITMNCGHADTQNYGTLENRREHYDNSCSVVANVRVGEDADGVWVAGALRHGVSAEQVASMMACRLSGDWQPHPDRPGVSEFIAALLVPVPGFPQARSQASVQFEDGVMVASSVPVVYAERPQDSGDYATYRDALHAVSRAKQIIVASVGLDPAARKKAIVASLPREK